MSNYDAIATERVHLADPLRVQWLVGEARGAGIAGTDQFLTALVMWADHRGLVTDTPFYWSDVLGDYRQPQYPNPPLVWVADSLSTLAYEVFTDLIGWDGVPDRVRPYVDSSILLLNLATEGDLFYLAPQPQPGGTPGRYWLLSNPVNINV